MSFQIIMLALVFTACRTNNNESIKNNQEIKIEQNNEQNNKGLSPVDLRVKKFRNELNLFAQATSSNEQTKNLSNFSSKIQDLPDDALALVLEQPMIMNNVEDLKNQNPEDVPQILQNPQTNAAAIAIITLGGLSTIGAAYDWKELRYSSYAGMVSGLLILAAGSRILLDKDDPQGAQNQVYGTGIATILLGLGGGALQSYYYHKYPYYYGPDDYDSAIETLQLIDREIDYFRKRGFDEKADYLIRKRNKILDIFINAEKSRSSREISDYKFALKRWEIENKKYQEYLKKEETYQSKVAAYEAYRKAYGSYIIALSDFRKKQSAYEIDLMIHDFWKDEKVDYEARIKYYKKALQEAEEIRLANARLKNEFENLVKEFEKKYGPGTYNMYRGEQKKSYASDFLTSENGIDKEIKKHLIAVEEYLSENPIEGVDTLKKIQNPDGFKKIFRKAMLKVHPDKGGSEKLAKSFNAVKEFVGEENGIKDLQKVSIPKKRLDIPKDIPTPPNYQNEKKIPPEPTLRKEPKISSKPKKPEEPKRVENPLFDSFRVKAPGAAPKPPLSRKIEVNPRSDFAGNRALYKSLAIIGVGATVVGLGALLEHDTDKNAQQLTDMDKVKNDPISILKRINDLIYVSAEENLARVSSDNL